MQHQRGTCLAGCFVDRFPDEGGAEKCPKWHKEMTARDAS